MSRNTKPSNSLKSTTTAVQNMFLLIAALRAATAWCKGYDEHDSVLNWLRRCTMGLRGAPNWMKFECKTFEWTLMTFWCVGVCISDHDPGAGSLLPEHSVLVWRWRSPQAWGHGLRWRSKACKNNSWLRPRQVRVKFNPSLRPQDSVWSTTTCLPIGTQFRLQLRKTNKNDEILSVLLRT